MSEVANDLIHPALEGHMRFASMVRLIAAITAVGPLGAQSDRLFHRITVDCDHSGYGESGSRDLISFKMIRSNGSVVSETTARWSDSECNHDRRIELPNNAGWDSLVVETSGTDAFLIDALRVEWMVTQGNFVKSRRLDLSAGRDGKGAWCLSTVPSPNVHGIAEACYPRIAFDKNGNGWAMARQVNRSELRNLAPAGTATQTSNYRDYSGPEKANDGKNDFEWKNGADNSVSHTNADGTTEWRVTFDSDKTIEEVVVWNGDDPSVWWRLSGALVQCWSLRNESVSAMHYYLPDMTNERKSVLNFQGVRCGALRVILQEKSRHLVLAEVEVWGR